MRLFTYLEEYYHINYKTFVVEKQHIYSVHSSYQSGVEWIIPTLSQPGLNYKIKQSAIIRSV